jgi:tetratricopeptide (TPR) repeat protein
MHKHPLTFIESDSYKKQRGDGVLLPFNRPFLRLASCACLLLLFSCTAFCQSAPSGPERPSPADTANPNLAEAESLLRQGRVNEADRAVRQFLVAHPESADGHFLLGHILFREIQADAAGATQLEGVPILRANPKGGNFIPLKARASLEEFTAGAKYHEPSAADLKVVALNFVLLGSYADADKWLTKMLEWTPGDADGWYLLGRTKYNENRFLEAVSAFQQSLRLAPRNVKTEDNLGLSYAGLGRNEEAVAAYQQAMAWQAQAAQKNPGPHINLASLLIDQNRSGEALPYLLQAIEIAPRESRAHELLGKAYTRMEQFPKAQAELEKAIELSPQSSNLHCMLAPVYRKQGLAEKAKAEFDRCATMTGTRSTPEKPRP